MDNIKDINYFLSEKKNKKEIVKRGSLADVENEEAKNVKKIDVKDVVDKIKKKNKIDKKTPKNKGVKIKRLGLGEDIKENNIAEARGKNYMFFQNIKSIKSMADEICGMDQSKIDSILSQGHGWATDHITTSKDDVEEVYHFLKGKME